MTDESPAAGQPDLVPEVSTGPPLPPESAAGGGETAFPIALRGYDRLAVDAYVKRTNQRIAELQASSSPDVAVHRGLERVGEEVAGILQRAHDAASQIAAHAESDAEERLDGARAEAAQITADAERRLQELDAETDRIWAERQRIVEDAQQLARELQSLAQAATSRFPAADETDTTTAEGPPRAGGQALDEEATEDTEEAAETEETGDEATMVMPPLTAGDEPPH